MNISDWCKNCGKSLSLKTSFKKVEGEKLFFKICCLKRELKEDELSEYGKKRVKVIRENFGYDDIFDKEHITNQEDFLKEVRNQIDNKKDVLVLNECNYFTEITLLTLNLEGEKEK